MGALFEREYKKLIVIHRAIFSEVEPENDEYEIVSRVKKALRTSFPNNLETVRDFICICQVFHEIIQQAHWRLPAVRLCLCMLVIWDTQVLYR